MSIADYIAHDGYRGLQRALELDRAAIVEEVAASGLRGRGGAGFPTGIKWRTVMNTAADQKYIVCNADEGDSGTYADRMIMEGDPFVLIEGMTIAGLAVSATMGYIYIRLEYPHAYLHDAAGHCHRTREGLPGRECRLSSGSKTFDLEALPGAGAYICGEETSLLESLEGRRGQIRPKPPLPAIQGLFGKPTVVNNVISLATVPVILAKGAKFYQDFGMGQLSPSTRTIRPRRKYQVRRSGGEGLRHHSARGDLRIWLGRLANPLVACARYRSADRWARTFPMPCSIHLLITSLLP